MSSNGSFSDTNQHININNIKKEDKWNKSQVLLAIMIKPELG